jgi:hypothetical protein
MIHWKIAARVETPAPLKQKYSHPGLDQAHRGEASTRPRADDDYVESFRSVHGHG